MDLYGTDRLAGAVFVDQTPRIVTDDEWKTGLGTDFPLGAVEGFLAPISADPEGFREGFVATMFLKLPPPEELAWMLDAVNRMPADHAIEVLRDHLIQDWRDRRSTASGR